MRSRAITLFLWLLLGTSVAWAQSSRFPGQLGSIPYDGGVTFRVWAPNATTVGVKGQFSGWSTVNMVNEGGGIWSIDVTGARSGQEYKYRINNSFDKRDPRSRRVVSSSGNSIIYDPGAFDWGGVPKPAPWRNDLVIYQMHLGTFGGQNPPSTFDQAISRLDHVRDLGISAIKLMPVNEFAGGRSWGYNPADLFAIESDYGGPEAMKRFMRAAHERGIAVIMDVVHNHYGPSDLDLWRFDGWSQNNLGGIYFYNDGRAHTPWGSTRPDFGRAEVRQFIRDQIFMWVEEFRIGGFRWDSVYNIINTDQGFNDTGRAMLNAINTELATKYPDVIRGAEDNAFDGLMNFENVWDVAWRWDLRGQLVLGSDADRNMPLIANIVNRWPSHARVIFTEAHDYIASNHERSRIPTEIHGADPESIFARKRSLLGAGIVMTAPGTPMIFQGQEMLETQAFHDDTPLRWNRTNSFAGIVRAYSDLIHARRNLRGGTQGLKGTGVNVHHVDNSNKVLAFIRWDMGGQTDDVVVVANFSNNDRFNYSIPFPGNGLWYSHFNSDSRVYGSDFGDIGDATVNVVNGQASLSMGRYSLQIFSRTPAQGTGLVTSDPAEPSGCDPVTIYFDPSDGPLAGATSLVLYHGRNSWLDVAETNMTFDSIAGRWSVEVPVLEGTFQIDVAFYDGGELWDTNDGRNWAIPISNCAGLPGISSVDPDFPNGCMPVTITYRERDGLLSGATNVNLFIGRNDWQNTRTIPMVGQGAGVWTVEYTIPDGTWQLDYVFNANMDGGLVWDNNDWNDWRTYVTGCVDSDFSGIRVTTPDSDVSVPYLQTIFHVGGTASRLQGALSWENQRTGETGLVFSSSPWQVEDVALDVGANVFRITGIGITDNPNAGARDSATNATYNAGWTNGQNGGANWGGGWQLSATTNSGHFVASSAANLNILPRAWGMWANSGGLSEAVRPFADRLHEGDTLRLRFENNSIANDTSVGFGLQNRFGQNLFEFIFIGGGTNYLINDAITGRPTGIPWRDTGMEITFELLTASTYRLSAAGSSIEGDLLNTTTETLIRQLRVFNASAGGGSEYNLYFSDISIDGDPLEAVEYTTSRTINRRYGPHFEVMPATENPEEIRIRLPFAETGYRYEIMMSTNLLDSNSWHSMTDPYLGINQPIDYVITNQWPQLFIRTRAVPNL